MIAGRASGRHLCGFVLGVITLSVLLSTSLSAGDKTHQIAISSSHETYLVGERIVFDAKVTLGEPVIDLQVKGFYPDPEHEVALTPTGDLAYRYEALAAAPEGARKLRIALYGRKKPGQPITPITHADKQVFVREATPNLTDARIKLTALSDAPDPFSAVVKGQNTFTSAYQVQAQGTETYIIRQHVLIESTQGDVLRDIETALDLQAGVTAAEVAAHWDGKNDAGQMLPDGLYAYEASGILYSHKVTAGNVVEQILGVTSPKTGEITLDNTKPTISATQDPPPNAVGWNSTDVIVTFSAQDNLSGIAEVTQPVTVTEEGKDTEVKGKAVDKAGNEATLTYKVSIDKMAPALTASQEPLPNANGWNNTDVIVTFQAEDELSGVAEVTAPVTVTEEAQDIEVPGSATDRAGNTSYTMHLVSIDKPAPVTAYARSPEPNKYGWNNTDVKLTFQPTDGLSGVAHTYVKLDDAETQDTTELVVSDEGEHTVAFWSVDEAGNAETEKTFSVNIDKTPPKTIPLASVTFDTPARIENGVIIVEQSSLRFRAPIDVDVVQALAFANNPALTVSAVIESVRVDVSGMQAQQDYVVTVRLIDKADNKSDSPFSIRNVTQEGPVDTDGDGIPDEVEIEEGLDPNDPSDGGEDADGDCLTNLQEYRDTHTDINNPDTDGDGMTDGCDEYNNGLDPLDPTGPNGWDGDLDEDGHPNWFELEIGTQPNDAGSGLAGQETYVDVHYAWTSPDPNPEPGQPHLPRLRELYVTCLFDPWQGGHEMIPEEIADIAMPAPLKAIRAPVNAGLAYPATFRGDVLFGIKPPLYEPVTFNFMKGCTFFNQPGTWQGWGDIRDEGGYLKAHGGAGMPWPVDTGFRRRINKDGRIPLPTAADRPSDIGEVQAWVYGVGMVTLDLRSTDIQANYGFLCAPLWTDVDMEITGMQTVGTSVRQKAPPYFVDPDPGTVVKVTVTLPGGREGYQGLNALREVYLSWPEGCFTATDEKGNIVGGTQSKPGSASFVWLLTRTEEPMPEDGSIYASCDSILPGHPEYPKIAPVKLGSNTPEAQLPACPGAGEQAAELEVESVEWLDAQGKSISENNDHPTAPVGVKYYPDATEPGGQWKHDVKVRVKVKRKVQGASLKNLTVYLKAFDPDDPSADEEGSPVDANDDGPDNRGKEGESGFLDPKKGVVQEIEAKTEAMTEATGEEKGVVTVGFRVAHQPGDNHKVAASLSKKELAELVVADEDLTAGKQKVKPDDQLEVTCFKGKLSRLLTVWRRLWVEFDHMKEPGETAPFGIIKGKATKITQDTLFAAGNPNWPADSLIGAVLNPDGTATSNKIDFGANRKFWEVISNTANSVTVKTDYRDDGIDNDGSGQKDDAGEVYHLPVEDPSDNDFALDTDDPKWLTDLNPPADVEAIIGLKGYFDPLYIRCNAAPGGWNVNHESPFIRNHTGEGALENSRDLTSLPQFWSVGVLWCYEKDARGVVPKCQAHTRITIFGDNDPEGEGLPSGTGNKGNEVFSRGIARIGGKMANVFCETVRDTGADVLMRAVAHEVGHLMTLAHASYENTFGANDNGIMGWNKPGNTCYHSWFELLDQITPNDRFSNNNIRDLRELERPPAEEPK